jgi:hypothetical protein
MTYNHHHRDRHFRIAGIFRDRQWISNSPGSSGGW